MNDSTFVNVTDRCLKGFNFEKAIEKRLANSGIVYSCNPLGSILHWMRYQGRGADFLLRGGIEVEAKFSHAKIYPKWIKRDWLTRFSQNARHKIIVSNKGIQLSEYSKRLLSENKIKHVFFDEFVSYIKSILQSIVKPLRIPIKTALSGKSGGNWVSSNRLYRYLKGLVKGITSIPSKVAITFNRYKSVIIRYIADRVNDISRLFQGRITVYNIYWVMAFLSFIQLVLLTSLEVK